jgi:hypothetical protein
MLQRVRDGRRPVSQTTAQVDEQQVPLGRHAKQPLVARAVQRKRTPCKIQPIELLYEAVVDRRQRRLSGEPLVGEEHVRQPQIHSQCCPADCLSPKDRIGCLQSCEHGS